ncbi:MAG: B12-binding domain-containing radical SAM protein [Nitrospirae bacterium]|nr:B12-binding domain-containing radical SAM protein [Nitrospirota bacterium]MCL5236812.1 B12-binding domain-containing radical SAM protein [Nitrospirota bacterium]
MKVILLYPGISGIGFNSYGKGMEESWISHGLCSISAYAKKEGFAVELIDLRCLKNWKHLKDIVLEKKPDVVGVTMMSVDYNPAMESIEMIKGLYPQTIIVVGGPHPTIMLGEIEKERDVDYIITGEGEISFAELLKQLEKGGRPPRIINGVAPEDLDRLPFADRELFRDLEYPLPVKGFGRPFVTIIAGRGCRFNCNYCQPAERIIFGKKVRRRSPLNVMEELSMLKEKYDFKSMMIHDDCITEDKNWVVEFCRLYRERGFNQPFACQSRADIICRNEDMVELMSGVGLKLMFIGFESGNQRILNFLRKGTKVEHNYRAAEICRKYGIKVWANYMLGVPTETKEEVMDTVRMIRTIKPDHYSPAFYTPHPGSDLFKYCEDHGLSLIKNHDSYRRNATEAKIKGVDYKFLNQALTESMGLDLPLRKHSLLLLLERELLPFLLRYPRLKDAVKRIAKALGMIQ